MHSILTLALFFASLSAASAADDALTRRNNDASTPVLIKSPPMKPFQYRQFGKPAPEDLAPKK
jgi:hypothetical protein